MLYLAVIDSDNELSEETIKYLKGKESVFLGDDNAMYSFKIEDITKAPKDIFKNHIRSMEMRFEE